MLMRSECQSTRVSRTEALIGAALTIGAALVVAATMLIGRNEVTETIGLVMFPGVLMIGVLWTSLRGRTMMSKISLVGGTLGILFLIGLLAGLAVR